MVTYFGDVKKGLKLYIITSHFGDKLNKVLGDFIENISDKDEVIKLISDGTCSEIICDFCAVKDNSLLKCYGNMGRNAQLMCEDALTMYINGEHEKYEERGNK